MLLTDIQKTILEKKNFNLNNLEKIEKFLFPNWDRDLLNPEKIKDINKTIQRIKQAIDNHEKIIIYTDYDCDGIPGAVILNDFFQKINFQNYEVYIPNRHNEGYGLNLKAIDKFIKDKVNLIITIDLGITNHEAVELAMNNKIDVIITDHHLPLLNDNGKQNLPKAYSIINTKQTGDEYEEKFLCGTSTIYKVITAFLNKYRNEYNVEIGFEKWLLDMVGLATISDLVPLQNENRLLAKYGLLVLKKTKRPGLRKMYENSKINLKNLNEDDLAFQIAPRINSASRMSDPIEAYKALLNNNEAVLYAEKLEKYNLERKSKVKAAIQDLDFEKLKQEKIILIGDEKWSPGILGLIASKVAEKTGKTTLVWGVGDDQNILKGSVRAGNENQNVVEIMSLTKEALINYGGHEAAGGFSLEKKNLEKFRKALEKYSKENLKANEEILIQKIEDTEKILNDEIINLKITDIHKNLFEELKIFAPFGTENPKIIFRIILDKSDKVEIKKFGKQSEHLEMLINNRIRGIEFFIEEEQFQKFKTQKEFLINLEWDNYRNDIVLKFLK